MTTTSLRSTARSSFGSATRPSRYHRRSLEPPQGLLRGCCADYGLLDIIGVHATSEDAEMDLLADEYWASLEPSDDETTCLEPHRVAGLRAK